MRVLPIVGLLCLSLAPAAWARDPLREQQWGLDAVNARPAWAVSTGGGIKVAVIDSGVDGTHEDLTGRVVPGPDFIDGDQMPMDENGHGTHVAGIIAANAGNGLGVEGAAPGARVLAIRVLDADSAGTTDDTASAIDAAVAARAQVINLSLSAGPNAPTEQVVGSPLYDAIERAVKAGAVVVAAAGNDSLPVCAQPVVQGRILCVGAVGQDLQRANFSNFGVRVDLVAPGDQILSTLRRGGYGSMSGTSQATPFVASAAALLRAHGLDARATIERIVGTARDLGAPGTDTVFGAGLLDMQAAVGAPDAPVPVPGPGQADARSPRAARISIAMPGVAARHRMRTFLRRGLVVRCRVATRGRCAARLTDARGRLIGKGSRVLPAGRMGTVRVRATREGRRRLRSARRVAVRLRVQSPGGATATQRLVLVR